VTRLEMALEVGEAMERLGVGKAESRAVSLPSLVARYNQQADKPLGLEQMRLLEELAQEFSVELNVLGYTVIPSPQSLRLPEAAKQPAFPELDAVWIDLGQGGAFTWSPSAAPLPEASLTEGKLPSWLEPEPAEGSQGLALGARIRLLPSLSLEGEVAPWGESAGYRWGQALTWAMCTSQAGTMCPPVLARRSGARGAGATTAGPGGASAGRQGIRS